MAVRDTIQRSVKKSIQELENKGDVPPASFNVRVERPQRRDFGDYSVSTAMQIASFSGRKPKTVAKILREELLKDEKLAKAIKDIRVAPPGFINFYLSEDYLLKELNKVFKDKQYGSSNAKKKSVNIEFGSVNPTGELHVGHARTFFYGDVMASVMEFAGFKVIREYYVNNARQSSQIKELGKTVLGKGSSYKGPYLSKKMKQYAKSLKRFKDYGAAGHFIANKIQEDIKSILDNKAEVKFDVWYEEEDLYKKKEVDKIVKDLEKKGVVYKNEGALWLKTSKYGDKQDQVLVRSSGEPTYFLPDLAYHRNKAKRGYKKIIDIWGADHHGHVGRMKAALKILGIKNVTMLIAQVVLLKGGGKLSKRKGTIVTVEDLINTVGLDAVRFFYLTKSLDSQMEFDIKFAQKQSQKNPVYYIQYTHARICGILRKINITEEIQKSDLGALKEAGEFDLVRKISAFPDVAKDTAEDYQVHRLSGYVTELAQEFNQFYRDFKVLTEDENDKKARYALAVATGIVMRQCLALLGIKAPEKM
ncbi:MAG: arginine--tRNA ligase [Candidatus Spechtbacterales bacterium]